MTLRRPEVGRVVFLTTVFDVGGAERVLVHTVKGLAERGWGVTVAGFERRSGQVADELRRLGVEVVDLGISRHLAFLAIPRLVALLRRERATVIYTFLIHAHLVGRVAARLAGTPVVLSSQQTLSWEGRFVEALNRWTARWCTRIVAVSRSVAAYMVDDVGVPASRVEMIPNCVDADHFRMPFPDFHAPIVIGSIARLSPEKDLPTLLRAFARIRAQAPAVRLILAGHGPERPTLERLVEELQLTDAVEFLGHVTDVRTVHARVHVVVLSSLVEGLPVAVLEAMAAGRPVVATAVGGNVEAVLDGRTGFLVAPRNPEALADAVLAIIGDPARALAMAECGQRHVDEHFTARAVAEKTHRMLLDLMPAGADTAS
jgi:glycosyltransferase involved in cell wall biosynthesis